MGRLIEEEERERRVGGTWNEKDVWTLNFGAAAKQVDGLCAWEQEQCITYREAMAQNRGVC